MGWSTGEDKQCQICNGNHSHHIEFGEFDGSGQSIECYDCGVMEYTQSEYHDFGERYESGIRLMTLEEVNEFRSYHYEIDDLKQLDERGQEYVNEYGHHDIDWEEFEEEDEEVELNE